MRLPEYRSLDWRLDVEVAVHARGVACCCVRVIGMQVGRRMLSRTLEPSLLLRLDTRTPGACDATAFARDY